ncbi:putative small integral membrane protein [Pseudomonas sp. GM25]|jgi:predicted small integral membrane protein|nr:putative integral membrane protein [Pseudomonas fluorescens Pf0-1]EJM30886.1 putative small integral membrane protein [Pseudomonas sp. GM25]TFA84734.1 putative small integral membrane protein [Pseudomonas sp. LAIL14HWK12:I2]SCZ30402.1 Predicted small integral membrane protein [Pseudomonas sp. NFIX46]SDB24813.1 Predicted small integral membrane protein [Pseudomonas putida]SFQ92991.1 Predicted small integral membrane protein [Pseudomonas sp. NFIX49]
MMEWMSWTVPTAAFFIVIGLILVGMTTWELRSPSILRRGFLPIATTRGDRLFIGLLGSAYLHLLVIGVTDWSIWVASALSLVWLLAVMRWG